LDFGDRSVWNAQASRRLLIPRSLRSPPGLRQLGPIPPHGGEGERIRIFDLRLLFNRKS